MSMIGSIAWYWWVLIAAGVVSIAYIKLRIFAKIVTRRNAEQKVLEDDE